MKTWIFSAVLAGMAMLLPLRADLVTVSTAVGNGADAYVRGGSADANKNFGSANFVISDFGSGAGEKYKDYFRFDLSALTLNYPDGYTPTLNLVTSNSFSNVGFAVYALADGVPGDAANGWTESGITYNNAPANNTGNNAGVITNTNATNYMTLVGSYTKSASTGDTVTFALNDSILQADTNGLITLALVRTGSSTTGVNFYSVEGSEANAPSLTVSTAAAAVPEPMAIIVAISAVAALAGMGLKKFRAATVIA